MDTTKKPNPEAVPAHKTLALSEEANPRSDLKPNRLPPMNVRDVQARAQRILEQRGKPPYTAIAAESYVGVPQAYHLSEDEALTISEFVYYWLPYLDTSKLP